MTAGKNPDPRARQILIMNFIKTPVMLICFFIAANYAYDCGQCSCNEPGTVIECENMGIKEIPETPSDMISKVERIYMARNNLNLYQILKILSTFPSKLFPPH